MAAKIRTRLCAGGCGRQQRTSNGYCKDCDARRKREARGVNMPKPETEGGKVVRAAVDKTLDLMDTVPGVVVEVPSPYGPIRAKGNGDGTIVPMLTDQQRRVLASKLSQLKESKDRYGPGGLGGNS